MITLHLFFHYTIANQGRIALEQKEKWCICKSAFANNRNNINNTTVAVSAPAPAPSSTPYEKKSDGKNGNEDNECEQQSQIIIIIIIVTRAYGCEHVRVCVKDIHIFAQHSIELLLRNIYNLYLAASSLFFSLPLSFSLACSPFSIIFYYYLYFTFSLQHNHLRSGCILLTLLLVFVSTFRFCMSENFDAKKLSSALNTNCLHKHARARVQVRG